jgi:AcrR family transcriptional regulator
MSSALKIAALVGRPRDHNREDAIENAAIELLREVGYESCTIKAVAARAQASKATIYRRWKNKQELMLSAVNRYSFCSSPEINTGGLRTDLIALITERATTLKGPDGVLIAALLTAAKSDAELGKLIQSSMPKKPDDSILQVIAHAMERGEISTEANTSLILEILPGIILSRIFMTQQVVNRKFIEQLVDDVLMPAFKKTNHKECT